MSEAERSVSFNLSQQELSCRLLGAVRRGDMQACTELLQAGADPNAHDITQNPPRKGPAPAFLPAHAHKQQWLLKHSAQGGTALHIAIENLHTDIVRLFLDQGARVNALDELNTHALHFACMRKGTSDIVRALIQMSGCMVNMLDGRSGRTPLHYAAHVGDDVNVKLLLHAGADVDAFDNEMNTATILYCTPCPLNGEKNRRKNERGLRYILARNPDIRIHNEAGQSALKLAVEHEYVKLVELLVQGGAVVQPEIVQRACAIKNAPLVDQLLRGQDNQDVIAANLFQLLVYTSSKWMIDHSSEERKLHDVARVLITHAAHLDETILRVIETAGVHYNSRKQTSETVSPHERPDLFIKNHGWVYLSLIFGKLGIARMLRMAGCYIGCENPIEENTLRNASVVKNMYGFLEILNEPLQLRQICRKTIRKCVKTRIWNQLQELEDRCGLDILDYLRCRDLDRVTPFDLCVRNTGEEALDESYADRENSKAAMAQALWIYPEP